MFGYNIPLIIFSSLILLSQITWGQSERTVVKHSLHISNHQFAVTRNLDLAIEQLGQITLAPGEQFSLNQTLGPRTKAKGYKKARVFSGTGEAITEFGGGMCILSTALYNLFLKAGLEIKERHPHMKVVSYAPAGLDAAVDFGSKDLIAKNNLPQTIHLAIYRQGKMLKGYLSYQGSGSNEIVLRREVYQATSTNHSAFRVRTVRSFFKQRQLIKEEILSEDTFKAGAP